MILIGNALSRSGGDSKLYAKSFAHGYRNTAVAQNTVTQRLAVYALTAAGAMKAAEIAGGFQQADLFLAQGEVAGAYAFVPGALAEVIRGNWRKYDAHVLVMATGIVVRKIAPLLVDKVFDPAVVVCDERGDFAVSLLSGHLGGANRLAHRIAGITGGQAVVTTATDVAGLMAFDELAAKQGWRVINPQQIKAVNSALLSGEPVDVLLPQTIFDQYYLDVPQITIIDTVADISGKVAVLLNCAPPPNLSTPVLCLSSDRYCLGIGCRKGVSAAEIDAGVATALERLQISLDQVGQFASINAKAQEEGLLEFARLHRIKIRFFSADELNRYPGPNPTPRALREFGVSGVAEPAALAAASGGTLILEKLKVGKVTIAVASKNSEDIYAGK